ncbi:MAG: type IV secretion system DNA-binding domain-containing protein [Patescibacteria group bacterium]|nr:type IV secretion system DNA-binding domain-containing protein [Patescibacteria group bacterium]
MVITAFALLLIFGGLFFGLYFYSKNQGLIRTKTALEQVEWVTLNLAVPKENEKGPEAAENLFAALHGIFLEHVPEILQPRVSLEIVAKPAAINFYVTCPKNLVDFIESQIYAQYPEVEIIQNEDYTQFTPKTNFAVAELTTTKTDILPIKTFPNFEVDPLSSITSVLSKISGDQQIWVQIIVRPLSEKWQKKSANWVASIKSTGKAPGANLTLGNIFKGILGFTKELVAAATVKTTEGGGGSEIQLTGPMSAALEGAETKTTKLGYQTKIRLIAFAEDYETCQSKVHGVVGSFKQFNTQNMNGFALGSFDLNNQEKLERYKKRFFMDGGIILNIEELASLYHLPNISVQTPKIAWAGSKKGEPPKNLPIEGKDENADLTIFGKTDFRGVPTKFGILRNDRRHHMYFIGKTGTGKSTVLQNMAISDIRKGEGIAVIDPHGELVETLLEYIPKNRIKDVVYFNPADQEFPIAFNLLENVKPELKGIVASGLIGIFKKIWADSWGPRLEYILRNDLLAILDYPKATFLSINRILVDKEFRAEVIQHIQDPVIKEFWISEYEQYDQKFRNEAIAPIQNKVGQFVSSPLIRNILGQIKSSIDINDIMNNKKIFLVNLSKGKIGEDVSELLGAMLITKIQIAALERATIKSEDRTDFYLYVDEFQNFATESFATILSEARKYKLNLIMANQYIAQMEESVREAVFGNVGTLVSYRVGPSDAPYLAKEYMPTFEETDLINLNNYHIYLKMSVGGVTSSPFSASTLPPYEDKENLEQEVAEASRKTYGKAIADVKKEIAEQSQSKIVEAFDDLTKPKNIKVGDKTYLERIGTTGHKWYFPIEKNGEQTPNIKAENPSHKEQESKKEQTKKISEIIKTQTPDISNRSKNNLNSIPETKIESKSPEKPTKIKPNENILKNLINKATEEPEQKKQTQTGNSKNIISGTLNSIEKTLANDDPNQGEIYF